MNRFEKPLKDDDGGGGGDGGDDDVIMVLTCCCCWNDDNDNDDDGFLEFLWADRNQDSLLRDKLITPLVKF